MGRGLNDIYLVVYWRRTTNCDSCSTHKLSPKHTQHPHLCFKRPSFILTLRTAYKNSFQIKVSWCNLMLTSWSGVLMEHGTHMGSHIDIRWWQWCSRHIRPPVWKNSASGVCSQLKLLFLTIVAALLENTTTRWEMMTSNINTGESLRRGSW